MLSWEMCGRMVSYVALSEGVLVAWKRHGWKFSFGTEDGNEDGAMWTKEGGRLVPFSHISIDEGE